MMVFAMLSGFDDGKYRLFSPPDHASPVSVCSRSGSLAGAG
jgi:hypothetical protein